MKRNLQKLFPTARRVNHCTENTGCFYLPLGQREWLELAANDLTEREFVLLNTLLKVAPEEQTHPWVQFLQGKHDKRPQAVERLQFVHIHLWKKASDEESKQGWLTMVEAMFPMLVAKVPLSDTDWLLVLDQSQSIDVFELLQESVLALEFDFGLRASFLVGQIWSQANDETLRQLYQEERSLFLAWQEQYNQARVLSFSHLFLWGQQVGVGMPVVCQTLRQQMDQQEQLAEIVIALWEEGAVATKAAQRLYIHRNTLQYRLEKWYELTGLQLRHLTDLAVCYALVIERTF